MGCGASAERYAPAERSEAERDQRAEASQGEAEKPLSLEPVPDPKAAQQEPADRADETAKPGQQGEAKPSMKGDQEPSTAQQAAAPPKEPDRPAAGETSVEPSVQHWQGAQPGAEGSKEWQRPATWPAPKEVSPPGPDAPHVVLSTKFEEPWSTISRGLKEILLELGCTVYNPNTDNKEPAHAVKTHLLLGCSGTWRLQKVRRG